MVYCCVSETAVRSLLLAALAVRLQMNINHRDVNMTSQKNTCMPYGKPDQKRKPKWNLFLEIFSVKIASE